MPDPTTRLNAALEARYRIERELGAGGMATVYLADDLKHERKVALKVLRPELTAVLGGDRFIQEIKTTAGLQHPHILPLFDSGEAGGFLYYVMPHVEGESLRAKLDRERQLDIDEALHIAKAVASALQYAHDRDVIHRDIKPENILLHAGEPVVADFGIALAISAAGGGRMTETGLSLGTPHYMSPEQASADRDLTVRSDVYSLACVLYEMLAGQPPHTGPTAQSILVRILTEEPRSVTDLRQAVPGHVAAVVSKGLEKLPADRFKSADELRRALDDPSFTHVRALAASTAALGGGRMPSGRSRSPWGLAHSAVTGLLALATAWLAFGGQRDASSVPEAPPVAFVARDAMPVDVYLAIEVGADGTVAFGPRGALWVRRPGELGPNRLIDAEWAEFAFSPDGEQIVYTPEYPGRSLRRIPVGGGASVPVSTGWDRVIGAPVWGEDGWIYFDVGEVVGVRPGLYRVPEIGGDAEPLLEVPGSALAPSELLPGGRALVYTQQNGAAGESRVMLLDLESRDTTALVEPGSQARWSPTGHLVHGHPTGALWAVPFDLDRLRITGPPVPVREGVRVGQWWTHYGLNRSGTLAYLTGFGSAWTFTLVDEEGNRETLPIEPSDHWDIAISPDGRLAAYTREDDIHIIDLDRGATFALTEGGAGRHNPVWSPDGSRVAYWSGSEARVRAVDRSAESRSLSGSAISGEPGQWLGDGTLILVTDDEDIGAARVDGDESFRMLLEADWEEQAPAVSPDGRWLAYVSDRDGTRQLYVRSWPDLEAETRISSGDRELHDSYPQWSPDSGTLYYVEARELIAADLRAGDGLVVEARRRLPGRVNGRLRASHPDGRLLIAEPVDLTVAVETDATSQLIVVTNWFTELRERLGGS